MDCKLTIIITFKNEGEEVFKTIKSLKEKSLGKYKIILINDNSDDSFNYDYLQEEIDGLYIKHKISKGPAVSRQEGIELSVTKYFLLLDAHMRAETIGWDLKIIDIIEKNPNGLFCCLTDKLIFNGNCEYISSDSTAGGVSVDLMSLSYNWLMFESKSNTTISRIPCLMGASYCGTKTYWEKIHGLIGLKSYGFEEQFLSLKTFLEGSNCYVINTVKFAHKFKSTKDVRYKPDSNLYIYNKLYIIELLYSLSFKINAFKQIRRLVDNLTFANAMEELSVNRKFIAKEKDYIEKIRTKDISDFVEFNNMFN